jgi:glutathione peroxidase-family protein
VEVVKEVWRSYAAQIDAIHVEVFENPAEPDALREAPAFLAWNLPSEPWVFVVDGDGRITARFEGTITEAELRGEVRRLVGE